jgi:hypothetical protein
VTGLTRPDAVRWAVLRGTHGHTVVVLTEFWLEDQGDGWWHCPSPLRCEVLDGPAQYRDFRHPFWLVRTDPSIEWHGDPYFWGAEEYPDHPLLHAMEPTPFALVTARQEEPIRPDLGILDGNVPAGPVLPDPEPVLQGCHAGDRGADRRPHDHISSIVALGDEPVSTRPPRAIGRPRLRRRTPGTAELKPPSPVSSVDAAA